VAAVIAAGIHPLARTAFHFDEAGTGLLTWTTRVYLLTLCGYALQEIMARAFYARKEAWWPFFGVSLRMAIYLTIAGIAVRYFRAVGAPAIAMAELSLTVEAFVMLFWLNRRLPEPVRLNWSLARGLAAAAVGGGTAYLLAVHLPGGAVVTALLGMAAGGLVALAFIWREVRLLLNL
jgi:putative peptidoglycan lipid II flippase